MPLLGFTVLSTEPNKINVTAIHYTNTTSTYYLEESIADLTQLEDLGYGWQRTGVYINHNLTNDNQEYFEVVLQHATTLPAYPWYRLNFYSPRFEEEKGVKSMLKTTKKKKSVSRNPKKQKKKMVYTLISPFGALFLSFGRKRNGKTEFYRRGQVQ